MTYIDKIQSGVFLDFRSALTVTTPLKYKSISGIVNFVWLHNSACDQMSLFLLVLESL